MALYVTSKPKMTSKISAKTPEWQKRLTQI